MRETNQAARDFADALRSTAGVLDVIAGKLEEARVHDFAFGRLFEATEVRDAYHQRLPETENDLAEAQEVIDHFVTGLEGGHAIARRELDAAEAIVPAQGGQDSQSSQGSQDSQSSQSAPDARPGQAAGADR